MVLAAALAGLVLAVLGVTMMGGRPAGIRRMQNAARVTVLALAAATAGVWLGAWAFQVARILRQG